MYLFCVPPPHPSPPPQADSAARDCLDAVQFCLSVGDSAPTLVPCLQLCLTVLSRLVEHGDPAASGKLAVDLRDAVFNSLVLAHLRGPLIISEGVNVLNECVRESSCVADSYMHVQGYMYMCMYPCTVGSLIGLLMY